ARLAAEPLEAEHRDALEALRNVQRPSTADVELGRGHVRRVLGRIVGQAEERLAQLCGRGIAEWSMPGRDVAETVEPVVDRAVELEHVEPGFDQVDERQEML